MTIVAIEEGFVKKNCKRKGTGVKFPVKKNKRLGKGEYIIRYKKREKNVGKGIDRKVGDVI